MNKKLLKQLVAQSYKGNNLDEVKVKTIAGQLSRKELKGYIKQLRKEENKKTVEITLAKEAGQKDKKELEGLFPDKKILYKVNPSLILGMEIKNNDMIYEVNFRNTLDNIAYYLTQEG